jgi:hypothetical protein
VRRLGIALAVLLAACGGTDGSTEAAGPPVCEPTFTAPSGYEPKQTLREEYADHVGVHRAFRDELGRELHFFAGIPGEFGEGLPRGGPVELTEGREGFLLGRGNQAWLVVWEEGGVCDPRVVVSNGLTRDEFLQALVEAGIAPPAG